MIKAAELKNSSTLVFLSTVILVVIIFLIRLPNLSIFNSISSYAIIRSLSLVALGITLFKSAHSFSLNKWLGFLILLYFAAVSATVLYAQNITSFLNTYKDVVSGFILFFCFYSLVNEKNLMIITQSIIFASIILLISELLLYFFPQLITPLFISIFNEGYLKFFSFQLNRDRLFGESLNEGIIPLFYVLYLKHKKSFLPILIIVILAISFTVFVSNWRTKVVIYVFSFLASTLLLISPKRLFSLTNFSAGVIVFIGIIGLFNSISTQIGSGSNVLSRFSSELDEYGSDSNTSRLSYWKDSLDIGNAHPLLGVGLGNYFDVLSNIAKSKNMNTNIFLNQKFILIDDPHNLFFSAYASTGSLGLVALFAIIIYFFVSDIFLFNKQIMEIRGFIILFWSIFIYALLNPWMYFQFLGQFWIVRAIIEKIKYLKTYSNEK